MTIGHVPLVASLLITVRFASGVQLSLMARPAASSWATVVIAAGAALAAQPFTFSVGSVPVIVGASTSFTVTDLLVLFEQLLASFTFNVTL